MFLYYVLFRKGMTLSKNNLIIYKELFKLTSSISWPLISCLFPTNRSCTTKIFLGKDVLKTSSLQHVFAFHNVFKTSSCFLQDIIIRPLLEDILKKHLVNTWNRLWRTSSKHVSKTPLRCVDNFHWKIVTLQTSSRHLGKQEMFAGCSVSIVKLFFLFFYSFSSLGIFIYFGESQRCSKCFEKFSGEI